MSKFSSCMWHLVGKFNVISTQILVLLQSNTKTKKSILFENNWMIRCSNCHLLIYLPYRTYVWINNIKLFRVWTNTTRLFVRIDKYFIRNSEKKCFLSDWIYIKKLIEARVLLMLYSIDNIPAQLSCIEEIN